MWNIKASTHCSKVISKVRVFKKQILKTSRSQGKKCWYLQKGLFTKNTHVKYEHSSALYSKVVSKVQFSELKKDRELQNDRQDKSNRSSNSNLKGYQATEKICGTSLDTTNWSHFFLLNLHPSYRIICKFLVYPTHHVSIQWINSTSNHGWLIGSRSHFCSTWNCSEMTQRCWHATIRH